jgi:type I restriction enzyme R subunit
LTFGTPIEAVRIACANCRVRRAARWNSATRASFAGSALTAALTAASRADLATSTASRALRASSSSKLRACRASVTASSARRSSSSASATIDRLGKTIIFAKNHNHAQFIVERFDANYPHLKGSFARVIDFQTEYVQSLLDNFCQADKPPHIAVSVDMLDTGIDVPEVLNLVFFKIVRSKTKFWQMLGRGTRLCPDLFGPGQHKEFFYVFDFCQNFEFFNQNPQMADGSVAESLAKRLFVQRVELVGEIDKREGEDGQLKPLRSDTAGRLHQEVAAMSLDNFIVRPKRLFVEHYAEKAAWESLSDHDRADLINEVAGLPSGLADDDLAAKEFDLLILRAQLALLRSDHAFAGLREKIVTIASLLEELQNVPMVAAELALILELQTDEYWQDITAPILETVRRRLRSLVKLIEITKRPIVYSDFEDEIGAGTTIEVTGVPVGTDMDRFRAKARQFLKTNQSHIAILKLYRNEPLTKTDLAELERMFAEAGVGTPEEIERIRSEGGFGLFVRSLVGLDRAAAKQAFDAFIQGRKLTAHQQEFVNMVIDHLTARGIMDPRLLYESPFTDFDPLGVAGVFGEGEVVELVQILREVQDRTAA